MNKTIIKYCTKYGLVAFGTMVFWELGNTLCNQKSDVLNYMGFTVYAGLLLSIVLVLLNDIRKLVVGKTETINTDLK